VILVRRDQSDFGLWLYHQAEGSSVEMENDKMGGGWKSGGSIS
jgi:hypothetical protein